MIEEFILWGIHPIVRGGQKRHVLGCIMSDVVLEIKDLTRRFGTFTAADALTLSVNAGEVFGLFGCILLTTIILVVIGARLYPQLAT